MSLWKKTKKRRKNIKRVWCTVKCAFIHSLQRLLGLNSNKRNGSLKSIATGFKLFISLFFYLRSLKFWHSADKLRHVSFLPTVQLSIRYGTFVSVNRGNVYVTSPQDIDRPLLWPVGVHFHTSLSDPFEPHNIYVQTYPVFGCHIFLPNVDNRNLRDHIMFQSRKTRLTNKILSWRLRTYALTKAWDPSTRLGDFMRKRITT
jgi:hypothetical protein